MFEPDSYRRPGTTMLGTLLLLVASSCLLNPAVASDHFRDSRENMIRLIEADVRHTSEYLKQSILDSSVLDAMARVPRHEFVPSNLVDLAYANRPLPIGHGQTISQPYIVAIMTDLLDIEAGHRILEVGTGSGYQAAVLAELNTRVWSIEIIEALGQQAQTRLQRLGYDNIDVRIGDGYYGWTEHAPFDAIIVTAAGNHIPPPLLQQLKPGGKMIIPVGSRFSTQQLILITRSENDEFITRQVLPVRFVPLTGNH
ncbi:MAG: protein-L-isoaspartate(D-aspartate) O-methyltransferase [Gammaproteobacteria bacterium]|nr:protein-L-isoaspartate(D-aspartate) O-methyltransferase [Gammaproteobacteria bacterium]MCZ6798159.1 protein-L-isoaspartate(D-aspartate) O-methyltransferase [Gammaproteobacteria bacterium]MCZ6883026.1 protein-L-isoaspartate(D-aspartate) O-methyltransferase [Gammaproteobacteria bacterium]